MSNAGSWHLVDSEFNNVKFTSVGEFVSQMNSAKTLIPQLMFI